MIADGTQNCEGTGNRGDDEAEEAARCCLIRNSQFAICNGSIRNPQSAIRNRGAVLVEFVFCMPILGFVIAMIMFFGWSMMNQQHVKMAARHSAWRHVRGPSDTTGMEINSGFFNNRADANSLSISSSFGWPVELKTEYQNVQARMQPSTGQLVERMVMQTFPKGVQSAVSAEFPTDVPAWKRFTGSIDGATPREGVEWRRGQAEWNDPVKDQFLEVLDSRLDHIPEPGNGLGQMIRQLYLTRW